MDEKNLESVGRIIEEANKILLSYQCKDNEVESEVDVQAALGDLNQRVEHLESMLDLDLNSKNTQMELNLSTQKRMEQLDKTNQIIWNTLDTTTKLIRKEFDEIEDRIIKLEKKKTKVKKK